jgi:uncharacterized protein
MTQMNFEMRCPTCDQTITAVRNQKFMPFCSERCQLIDLGRWLSEENAVVADRDEDEETAIDDGGRSGKKIVLPPGWHDA